MADEIDRLEIAVEAEANRANRSLNGMEKRLNRIADSLEKVVTLTAGFKGFDNFDTGGLAEFRKDLDSIFEREKKVSREKFSPRVDRSDVKYTEKSLDAIYEKFKDVGKGIDLAGKSLPELKKGLNLAESAAKRFNDRLDKKVSLEGTEKLGKSWESLVYDIQKSTNRAEEYREAIRKIKQESNNLDFKIERGDISSQVASSFGEPRTVELSESNQYDTSEIEKYINDFAGATAEANTFEAQIKSLKAELADLASQGYSQYDPEYDTVAQELAEVTEAQKQYNKALRDSAKESLGTRNAEKTASAMKNATEQAGLFRRAIQKIKGTSKNINSVKKDFDNVGKSIRNVVKLAKGAIHPLQSIKNAISGENGSRRGMSWGRMIGSSVLFNFVFQGISAIQNAIKEGSDNLVQYSSEYNRSISSVVSSLLYLKNAWAAAFSPITNVVAPYISQFVDMMASALNAVGQFMAALTGKGFAVQAKKVWKDYAAGLDTTKDSASDAEKALKDLQNYTLGIDELNVIQPNDNSSSGSGSGTSVADISSSDMFETIEVSNSVNKFAELFKESWEEADFTEIGRIVGDKLNDALLDINWGKIKTTSYKIGSSVATFLNGVFETPGLFNNIGMTIGEGLNTAIYLAKGFVDKFHWSSFGNAVADSINGFFRTVEWGTLGRTISDGVIGALDSVQGFLNRTEWESLADSIVEFLTSIKWGEILVEGIATLIDASIASTRFFKGIGEAVAIKIVEGITGKKFSDSDADKFRKNLQPFEDVWDYLFTSSNPIMRVKNAIDKIQDICGDGGQNVKDTFADLGDDIADIVSEARDFMAESFQNAYDMATFPFKKLGEFFDGVFGNVQKILDKFAPASFSNAFGKARKSVEEAFKGLSDFFKGVANEIISPIGKLINGMIKGVNWVLDKVGSKKRVTEWSVPKFASGTNGLSKDTFGMVNDQKGSTYKELIVPPSGKPFIPEGRNVMLPLQKGTKIMPADETKALMSVLPHFAGGIGDFFGSAWAKVKDFTGNVLDYITHPDKIVQIALDKFVDISNMVEPLSSIAKGAVNTVFDGVVDYVKGIFDEECTVKYNPSAGVEQWRKLATKALQMTGQFTEANLTRLLYQMQTESGGNPNAINNWDINAKNGIPSKGLMQVIDPTFRAYAYPGYNTNIYDPLSNMLAAIRYTVSRYGSLAKGWQGHGYASGIGQIKLSDFIPRMADGGILRDGQMFIAREKGPELVGNYGNKTTVMNNNQIVQSVSSGVEAAFERQNARTNALLEEIAEYQKMLLDKDTTVNIDGKKADKQLTKARRNSGYSFSPA